MPTRPFCEIRRELGSGGFPQYLFVLKWLVFHTYLLICLQSWPLYLKVWLPWAYIAFMIYYGIKTQIQNSHCPRLTKLYLRLSVCINLSCSTHNWPSDSPEAPHAYIVYLIYDSCTISCYSSIMNHNIFCSPPYSFDWCRKGEKMLRRKFCLNFTYTQGEIQPDCNHASILFAIYLYIYRKFVWGGLMSCYDPKPSPT